MGTWLVVGRGTGQHRAVRDGRDGALCGFIIGLINPKGIDGVVVAPDVATDYRNENCVARPQGAGHAADLGFKSTPTPTFMMSGQIYNGENGKIDSVNISLQPDGTAAFARLRRLADVWRDPDLDTREVK